MPKDRYINTNQSIYGAINIGNMAQNVNMVQKNTLNEISSSAQEQSLVQAAAEIQQLLEQLDKTYSTGTTSDKMIVAAEAIAQIENNPNLTARILSALKVGSVKAFEQALSHPAASFVIGALEDWQKTKGS